MDEEFSALQASIYQMCGGEDLIYNFHNKKTQNIPQSFSAVLRNLSGFASIEEHFDRISRKYIKGIEKDAFQLCIKDLHNSGLLVTKDQTLQDPLQIWFYHQLLIGIRYVQSRVRF